MAASFFSMRHLKLPVVVVWDLIHQSVNEVLLALQRAKLWPVVLELLLVFRLPYGPWAGQKFWRDLQDAGDLAASSELWRSAHFQNWLGSHLAAETGGDSPWLDVWRRKGVRRFFFYYTFARCDFFVLKVSSLRKLP